MPRLPRIDAPGVIHHVIIRGIEKRAIFQDQTDYEDFPKRLEALIPETQTRCYAWVLMTHHAHFLFRCGPKGLSILMQRLLTGYGCDSTGAIGAMASYFRIATNPSSARLFCHWLPAGAWALPDGTCQDAIAHAGRQAR